MLSLHQRSRPFVALCALALLGSTLGGCVALFVGDDSPSEAERKQIELETQPYRQKGTGVVSGIVTLETPSGRMVAPAGAQVYLTPATSSSIERLQKYGIERNEMPPSRYAELVWMTRTDAQGRFEFDDLPPGEYISVCQLGWTPPTAPGSSRTDVAWARFRLGAGERANVVLNRRDDG